MSKYSGIQPVLLAAGSSTRMGRPKALLEYTGETLLGRIARALDAPWVVIGGDHQTELQAECDRLGVRAHVNDDPSAGPVSSIRRALLETPYPAAYLIHPVDIPGVRAEDVGALCQEFTRTAAPLIVPEVRGRLAHPVLVARALALRLQTLPHMRALYQEQDVEITTVPRENLWLRRDIDTPEDWEFFVSNY